MKPFRRFQFDYITVTMTIGVLLYLAVLVFPLLLSLYYSFTNFNLLKATNNFIGVQNYITMLGDDTFLSTLLFTLKTSIIVTVLANVLGLMVALALNHTGIFYTVLRTIFFIPQVLSSVVIGFIWSGMLNSQRGLVNTILRQVGMIGVAGNISWLGTPGLATFSVIAVCVWQMVGFCTVVYLAALQSVPQDLKDAANVDGANPWQSFWNVTFPLLSPGVTVNVVMLLIMMFKLYDIIQVMTSAGPAGSTESLAFYVTRMAFTVNKVGYASAMAVVLFIFIAFISACLGVFLRSREVEY
ncbi:MAG: sugar ABC transporter permease [Chloroflexi bacterium]|nr:sugar ABC transporter permease [Chloroflexota bacterium]